MIVMMCTAAKGGMLSVVEGYRSSGLFSDCNIRLIVTHDNGSVPRRLWLATSALLALLRALFSGQVSGVHLHAAMRGSFWRKSMYGLVARLFRARVVYHLHGSEMEPFVNSLPAWARRLLVRLLERADTVIVLSASWQHYIRTLAPQANVRLVPNYITVGARPQRLAATAEVRLLFLGALGRRKGIYDLLPAFADALKVQPGLVLRVGGDGELSEAVALAQQLGITAQVQFLGWVSGADKQHELAAADVYVLPSYNEGLPMSILEAMGCGLPVLSTRVGGIPEAVLDGRTGLIIEAGDRAALARGMVALASSAPLRLTMGEAGYDHVRAEFSEQAVVPRIKALYREMGMQ